MSTKRAQKAYRRKRSYEVWIKVPKLDIMKLLKQAFGNDERKKAGQKKRRER